MNARLERKLRLLAGIVAFGAIAGIVFSLRRVRHVASLVVGIPTGC